MSTFTLTQFQRGQLDQLISEGTTVIFIRSVLTNPVKPLSQVNQLKNIQSALIIVQNLTIGKWIPFFQVVVSLKGLVTFVERQSRLLWVLKVPNRTALALNNAFRSFIKTFGSQVKSITVDHGKEFSKYRALEKNHKIDVYFCHPYSPWEPWQ